MKKITINQFYDEAVKVVENNGFKVSTESIMRVGATFEKDKDNSFTELWFIARFELNEETSFFASEESIELTLMKLDISFKKAAIKASKKREKLIIE